MDQLLLDAENPRLPRFQSPPTQEELLQMIVRRYSVSELIDSFAINGYFEEEPLVATPAANGKFTVVEGNRRLAALILLHNPAKARDLRVPLPSVTRKRRRDLKEVPVRVHQSRSEVLPFLGYRHITGVMAWDSYSKARYVAQLVEQGETLSAVQRRIGDRHETASRLYRAYLLWEQLNGAQPADDPKGGQRPFSYLFTALTFKPILDFVGLVPQQTPRQVDKRHLPNLRQLSAYLYGGKHPPREPAISESRQIKDLAQALASEVGRRRLAKGDSADEALEAVPAESARFERLLSHASSDLLKALQLAPRQKNDPIARDLTSRTLELAYGLAERMNLPAKPR